MQKLTPSLWFDDRCEEAVNYYVSVFPNSSIISIKYYPEKDLPGPPPGMQGKVLTAIFELDGMRFIALDGGPIFKPNEAISFQIECEDQKEVDYYHEKLSAHPESVQCGWVKDRFGFSWQVTPKRLGELLSDSDKAKADRVLMAMLKMKKIDIAELERAAQG